MSERVSKVKICPLIPEGWKYRSCDFPRLREMFPTPIQDACAEGGCVLRIPVSVVTPGTSDVLSLVQMATRAEYYKHEAEEWKGAMRGAVDILATSRTCASRSSSWECLPEQKVEEMA